MPVEYKVSGVTLKETFAQKNAAKVLGVDLGRGVCQICCLWWLEHMKAGGAEDNKSFVFNASAPQLKELLRRQAIVLKWSVILDTRMESVGFKALNSIDLDDTKDSDLVKAANIAASSAPNYHLVIIGHDRGTNHVIAAYNDGTTIHLFEPNSGHFKTSKKGSAKNWLKAVSDFYTKHDLSGWKMLSYSKK